MAEAYVDSILELGEMSDLSPHATPSRLEGTPTESFADSLIANACTLESPRMESCTPSKKPELKKYKGKAKLSKPKQTSKV